MAADIATSFESPKINQFEIQKKLALERATSISQNLFCAQCEDYFKTPKILPCLHYFCEDCIHNHMVRNNEITCAKCHESTPSTNKISKLMTHTPIADLIQLKQLREKVRKHGEVYCMNCSFGDTRPRALGKFYCCDCKEIMCLHDKVAHDKYKPDHRSIPIEDFREEEDIANLLSNISTLKCKKHGKQDIKYFCVECEQHICDACQFEEHNTHKKTFLEAALNLFSDSVDKKMEMFETPKNEMSEEVDQMEENMTLMENRKKETIDKIQKHFTEIIAGIEKRRDTLIGSVNVWYSNLRAEVFSSSRKQNELLEKIGTLEDFVSSYKNYPNSYKIELTSVTTKRFNHLSSILPKVPLKIKTIGYEKGADNEFKIDNIGFLKYETKTCFESPIKKLSKDELVPKNINHFEVEDKNVEFRTYEVQAIAEGHHNNLYVFNSECADKEATGSRYVKDGFQVLDANCNITQTLTWTSILKNPTQILIGRENQVYILDAEQKHIIIRSQSFNRTIRAITSDDSSEISHPSSIALTSSFDLVVHNRQLNQLVILKNEDFSVHRKLSLKSNQLKPRDSPTPIARADSRIRSSDRDRKQKPAAIPERKTPLKDNILTGSITIGINSKDYIYVASEDRALITIYDLEGTEIDEINFQERLRYLEEKDANERKSSGPETDPKEKQARRSATLLNKNPPPLSKKMSTIKPPSINTRSTSPTNLTPSKTLLKIDSLDNIYVYQKNFIIMFDPQHKYSASAKIGPAIDPVSMHANSIGHVYVMSEKGELHVFN